MERAGASTPSSTTDLDAYDLFIDARELARSHDALTPGFQPPSEWTGTARLIIRALKDQNPGNGQDDPLYTVAKPIILARTTDNKCQITVCSGPFRLPLTTLARPVGSVSKWSQQCLHQFVVALSIELDDAAQQSSLATWLGPREGADELPAGRLEAVTPVRTRSAAQSFRVNLAFRPTWTRREKAGKDPMLMGKLTFTMSLSRNLSYHKDDRYPPLKQGVYVTDSGKHSTCPAEVCYFCNQIYLSDEDKPKTANAQSMMLLRHLQQQHKEVHLKKVEIYGSERVRIVYQHIEPKIKVESPPSTLSKRSATSTPQAARPDLDRTPTQGSQRLRGRDSSSTSSPSKATRKRQTDSIVDRGVIKTPRKESVSAMPSPLTPKIAESPASKHLSPRARAKFTVPETRTVLFRQQTKQALQPGEVVDESDNEIDETWLQQEQVRLMAEDELSAAAVSFHTLFNGEVVKNGPLHNRYLPNFLIDFVQEHAVSLQTTMRAPFKAKLLELRKMNLIKDVEIRRLLRILTKCCGTANGAGVPLPAPKAEEGDCQRCRKDVEHPEEGVWCSGDYCRTTVWHKKCVQYIGNGRGWLCVNCRPNNANGH